MNPDDIRLCAEESGLDKLWEDCGGKVHQIARHNQSYSELMGTAPCPDCKGTGRVPHVGPDNIVYLEGWFFGNALLATTRLPEGYCGQPTQAQFLLHDNIYDNCADIFIPARVEGSVRIIAEAIREHHKDS